MRTRDIPAPVAGPAFVVDPAARRPARRGLVLSSCLVAVLVAGATACSDDPGDEARPSTTLTPAPSTTGSPSAPTTTSPSSTPDLETAVVLRPVAKVVAPTAFASRTGTDVVYVAERAGLVRALTPSTTGEYAISDEPTLDLRDLVTTEGLEQGLLGIAFDPDGTHLVVSYSAADSDGGSVIARYEMAGDVAVESSRRELLTLDQPFPNHNGGNVAFGPDGYLYAGFGDGGSQGDPNDNGQNPATLLATIIRIDPSAPEGDRAYRIPPDNPFATADPERARPEVWLYGVRNPWRFSFDRATGDLWVADVGGSRYEEVNLLRAADGGGRGANLGWSLREGRHDTDKDGTRPDDTIEPIHEYDHDSGNSISGGYVYRGSAIPGLQGAYLFSDFGQSTLRAVVPDGDKDVGSTVIAAGGGPLTLVSAFGQDNDGELFVMSFDGTIYRIEPA